VVQSGRGRLGDRPVDRSVQRVDLAKNLPHVLRTCRFRDVPLPFVSSWPGPASRSRRPSVSGSPAGAAPGR
jgi:hypothetical protein